MTWFMSFPWGEICDAVSPSPSHPALSLFNMLIVRLFAKAQFKHLLWWQKAKLIGVATLPLCLSLHPALCWSAVHLLLDFTLQSGSTAARKSKGGWALFIHAVVAGGWPGAIAGFLGNGLQGLLWGVFVGAVLHWCIDRTNKFNISSWQWAITVDQLLHLGVLGLIWAIV